MKEDKDIFGVIFKQDEEIFIIEYQGHNTFSQPRGLTNNEPYKKLNFNQASLVFATKVDHPLGYMYNIRDLSFVSIGNYLDMFTALDNKEVLLEISNFFENIITKALEEEKNSDT